MDAESVWLREIGDERSMYLCAKGDPGAVEYVPAEISISQHELDETLSDAMYHADVAAKAGITKFFDTLPHEFRNQTEDAVLAVEKAIHEAEMKQLGSRYDATIQRKFARLREPPKQ